jgi:hypothetical protein
MFQQNFLLKKRFKKSFSIVFCLFKLYDNLFFLIFLCICCLYTRQCSFLWTQILLHSLSFHISIFYLNKVIWIHCSLLFSKKICTKNSFFWYTQTEKEAIKSLSKVIYPPFVWLLMSSLSIKQTSCFVFNYLDIWTGSTFAYQFFRSTYFA